MPNKTSINTLILSDIHLGLKTSRPIEAIKIIESYDFKRLILNGDIFDSLNFNRLHTEHWDFLSKIRSISKMREVVWVCGNHDGPALTLSSLLGIKIYKKYFWHLGDKKLLAIHGHQFDRFLYKNILISKIAVWFYYFAQRLDTKNKFLTHWLKNHTKSYLRMSEEVKNGAILYAKLRKADFVFCGHTHKAEVFKSSKVNYYNSGSWTTVPSNYIIIKNGNIELK
ncbi:MAG: UDP-2,3-diacylglucosamine diphosphatase, partial [Patescibacteria group bacterium]|nr:UDP-2,3-diacylglucosamine diphosphatase [Patescibacteria group bacterium]